MSKAATETGASLNSAVEDSDVKPLIPASPADAVQKGSEKKKKKKIAVSELLENFESFDYKAAASSIAKGNISLELPFQFLLYGASFML